MNILHIIPTLRKGGAERIVLDTCIELQKHAGVQVKLVTLYALCEYPDLAAQVDWNVVTARFVPSITRKCVRDIKQLEQLFTDFQPDIIHTHLWEAEMVARQVSYQRGRWFTHLHDNMRQLSRLSWPITKQKITDWYERSIILHAYDKRDSHFIAISRHCEAYAQANLPKRFLPNITFMSNAINTNRFRPQSKLSVPDALHIASIGSLVAKKNHLLLIEIAHELRKSGVQFTIDIMGDGVLRNELQSRIDASSLNTEVLLRGLTDQPETVLWKSSLYVHTATYEPFGLVLLEAMAAGLPVVTLNGGGNADIIEDGKNGFIIDSQDPKLFADKILEIWQDKKRYSEMSEYASRYAQQFDIKEYAVKLLSLYRQS